MGMESRWGRRRPIELDVVIDCRHHRRLRGYLRDVSSSGAFVTTPALELPLNSLLDLVFTLHEAGVARVQRVRAMVTRLAPDGAGLMFSELMPPGISMLLATPPQRVTREVVHRVSLPVENDSVGVPEADAERTATG